MEKPQQMEVEEDEYSLTLIPGISAIQGRRPYMEDRHTVLVDLLAKHEAGEGKSDTTTTTPTPSARNQHSFFAVYDGHGGQFASTFASENLYKHLASSTHLATAPTQALHEACDTTDRLYAESHKTASSQDGTTACMVLIAGRKVITANVGDSRAVMCRNGEPLPLSFDHKPDKKEERQRIEEAGGIVKKGSFFNIPMGPFRVYQGDGIRGGLAVSRALGDTFYKDPTKPKEQWLVSGIPEITQETLSPGEDEFIIVASDGFWDVFTNEGAIKKARVMLTEKNMNVEETARALTELAFMRESLDNVTVVVVKIRFTDKDGAEVPSKAPAVRKMSDVSAIESLMSSSDSQAEDLEDADSEKKEDSETNEQGKGKEKAEGTEGTDSTGKDTTKGEDITDGEGLC